MPALSTARAGGLAVSDVRRRRRLRALRGLPRQPLGFSVLARHLLLDYGCSTTGRPRGAAGGAPGARRPAGVGDGDGGRRGRDGGAGAGTAGPLASGCEQPKGRARPPRPSGGPHGGLGFHGRRARQATADRAPRGCCSASGAERLLPLVCNDRFGGLRMHGGNYIHWLVTARVNLQSRN